MADDDHGGDHGGHAKGPGGGKLPADPKKRKMMAVGIGAVGIIVAFLIFRRGSGGGTSSSGMSTDSSGQVVSAGGAGGVTADVAVPSGDVSPTDLMAQFANTIAADQSQNNTAIQNQISALSDGLAAVAGKSTTINVNNPVNTMPGCPPTTQTTAPAPAATTHTDHVTVLPWNQTGTAGALNGHPWQSSLWGIGQHYHEDWPTIWKANPQIQNPNLLHPGDVVNVPGLAGAPK